MGGWGPLAIIAASFILVGTAGAETLSLDCADTGGSIKTLHYTIDLSAKTFVEAARPDNNMPDDREFSDVTITDDVVTAKWMPTAADWAGTALGTVVRIDRRTGQAFFVFPCVSFNGEAGVRRCRIQHPGGDMTANTTCKKAREHIF